MGCMKNKKGAKPKSGRYRCCKCGVAAKKKNKLCNPRKIK